MNREIKFRVWCPASKHFSTQPWLSCDGVMLKWEHAGDIQTLTDIRFDNYVIQQYTGIKDKNGKEIYEGDILKFSNTKKMVVDLFGESIRPAEEYIVKISRNRFGTYFGQNTDSSHYSFLDYENWEVIGNIFENPELLEK